MYSENVIKSVRQTHSGLEYVITTTQGKYIITASDFRRIGEDILKEGISLDDEITYDLEFATEKLECIQKCLKFLEYGDMSEKKLRMKLATNRKVRFSAEAVDGALEILKENGYINDEYLAKSLCEECFVRGRMSPGMIKAKLFQRGFDSSTINILFDEFDFDEQTIFKNMESLVREKFGDIGEISDVETRKKTKIKALEYLVRKGYSYDEAKSCINNLV